ncbi:mitochondrial ribonuclease P protein 3-like isoform X2 [Acanthaster planci]|nr:mitochondrial ribonuclease P protein 3-like isoform X2 [Acanthaster planci]XP_022081382.1 mitochondrial ribonuclease P protein 3-like isoform X2 [Acanthaster planci]
MNVLSNRMSTTWLLRYHFFCWKRCFQSRIGPTKSRQIWTPAELPKSPAIQPAVSTGAVTDSSGSRMSMRGPVLPPQIINSFWTCKQLEPNVGHSNSRNLSTSSAALLDHSQEKEGRRVNVAAENNNLDGTMGEKSREGAASPLEDLEETDECLSAEQWKLLKEEWNQKALPHQSQTLFESRTMARLCNKSFFQKGRSLMDFIRREEVPLTYPLMSSYLYLCVCEGHQEELFSVYNWFTANHPVLDDGVLTNLIAGFSQTDRWRESLRFLEDLKQVGAPSARNYQLIICTACDQGEYNLVEELLQDLYSRGNCPSEQTCLKLLQTFHCETEDVAFCDRSTKLVSELLRYFSSKRLYPSVAVGNELKHWFHRRQGEVWKASMTRVTIGGKCKCCGSRLESLDIGEEEFLNLQHQITEKVIKGGDIFQKTRPDEFEAFMEFVDEGAPYDIIIDGLNLAHIRKNTLPSKLLRQFVVYLAQECGLKCLVLGRQHMLQYSRAWTRHHMDVIRDLADCFFTENISEDDPFMLYATLHSGPKACYVSRDMLRDHKALLDQPTHISFVKWQRGHQIYPLGIEGRKAVFKDRIAYDTVAQCSDTGWHIPCDDGLPRYSYQVPLDWLCARRVK